MKIQWREALSIDNGPIDADHKHLISLINQIIELDRTASMNKEFVDILSRLKKYTIIHFQREETLQKAADFPECDSHEKEHTDLVRKLDTITMIAKKELNNTSSSSQSNLILEQTQKFLKAWLLQHVIGHDLKMKDYVEKMKEKASSMPPIDEDKFLLD